MSKLTDSFGALFWLALCIGVALTLLATAIIYKTVLFIKPDLNFKGFEVPNFRF
ncbi:MAG: hypothetical protein AAB520_01040 [Patescibacteria group bacterium]